jgi:hypothetical protein
MRLVRRSVVGHSIADKPIHAREPQLLKLPIPLPSIPILAPLVSPVVGGSNKNTRPGTTTPANTPPPAQPTPPPAQPPPPPAQPTPPSSPPPSNYGSASPPSGSTPSTGGDGFPVPVPPVAVPGSGTGSGDTPPSGSPSDSPTTGSGPIPSGATTVPSPTSILEGGGRVTVNLGSDKLGNGANDPSAPPDGGIANAGGVPTALQGTGGSNTLSAGGSRSTGTSNTTSNSDPEKGHTSTGAIAGIIVIFITLFLALLAFFLRRRSRARRNEQANTWWFVGKRMSQTYGDRNSAEIFTGLRNTRSSFATTASHSFHTTLSNTGPTLPPLLPTAEVGRVNLSSLQAVVDPSRCDAEISDERFSTGSNYSETSQYLFVNLRNSLQDPTPVIGQVSPSHSFAFPKPPSPAGDRTSAYSRLSCNAGTFAATVKRLKSDELLVPSLSAVPSTPAVVPLTNNDPSGSDPFADANPFEDPQRPAVPAIHKEIVRRPFQHIRQDEVTVNIGESVHVLLTFDDGWAYVVKVPVPGSGRGDSEDVSGGSKGLIPIDCLRETGLDLVFIAAQRVSSYGNDAIFTAL